MGVGDDLGPWLLPRCEVATVKLQVSGKGWKMVLEVPVWALGPRDAAPGLRKAHRHQGIESQGSAETKEDRIR